MMEPGCYLSMILIAMLVSQPAFELCQVCNMRSKYPNGRFRFKGHMIEKKEEWKAEARKDREWTKGKREEKKDGG